jgi:hypothetical protein
MKQDILDSPRFRSVAVHHRHKGHFRRHAVLVAALWLYPIQAFSASMPAELIGNWCAAQIDRSGYSGHADGEGYACKLKTIRQPKSYDKNWIGEFTCSFEDRRGVRQRSFFHLREFEGSDLLIIMEMGSEKPSFSAPTGGRPKVIGSSMAMVGILRRCR